MRMALASARAVRLAHGRRHVGSARRLEAPAAVGTRQGGSLASLEGLCVQLQSLSTYRARRQLREFEVSLKKNRGVSSKVHLALAPATWP
jgi:hypothetical protein